MNITKELIEKALFILEHSAFMECSEAERCESLLTQALTLLGEPKEPFLDASGQPMIVMNRQTYDELEALAKKGQALDGVVLSREQAIRASTIISSHCCNDGEGVCDCEHPSCHKERQLLCDINNQLAKLAPPKQIFNVVEVDGVDMVVPKTCKWTRIKNSNHVLYKTFCGDVRTYIPSSGERCICGKEIEIS